MAPIIRVLLTVCLLWVTVSIATEFESDTEQDDTLEIQTRSKRDLWRTRLLAHVAHFYGGMPWWRRGRGRGGGGRRTHGPENAGDEGDGEGDAGQGSDLAGRHRRPDMEGREGEEDDGQGSDHGPGRPLISGRPGRPGWRPVSTDGWRHSSRIQSQMQRRKNRIAARLEAGEIVFTEMSDRAQRMINFLSTAVNTFTSRLHPQLKQRNDMMYSPYGIYKALLMSFMGARGITAFQMKHILSLQRLGRFCHRALKKVDILLMSIPYVSFPTTILLDEGVDIDPIFSSKLGLFYTGNATAIDIGDPDGAETAVNDWIVTETNDGISSILSADTLAEADSMTLVNGMYFKAKWKTSFPVSETSAQMFKKTASEELPVQMMQVKSMLRMGQIPGQQGRILEVPFQGSRFSMVIYLPDAIDGLPAIENALTSELISIQLATIFASRVHLELPKFTLESAWTLKNQLQEIGLTKPFTPDTADFSFLSNSTSLHINDVVHKAVVEIDEQGEETAQSSGETTVSFRCDRPFLFVIRHTSSKIPFLVGKFSGGV